MEKRGQQISEKAGECVGQAQMKRDEIMNNASKNSQQDSYTEKASNFLQQTGEQVKNMATGAADAVKNTLGMNADNNTTTTTHSSSTNPSSTTTTATATATATNTTAKRPSNPTSTKM